MREDASVIDPMRSAVAESVHVPLLIMLGGLPGTGKSTIAQGLARELSAVHIRIDTIEAVLSKDLAISDHPEVGYRIGYAVALDNLRAGHWVIADAVNPLPLTRDAWRSVAEATRAAVVEIEVVCSDQAVHRDRVENRAPDIPGVTPPTWQQVIERQYEPWEPEPSRIDTAHQPIEFSIRQTLTAIMRSEARGPA
jgi:predicted kinase